MTNPPTNGTAAANVISKLNALRELDAPTHGGRVLAYVYDSGLSDLDTLAGEAASIARPLNGLDPTAFPSIAAMERDLIAFTRRALNGHKRTLGGKVVGSITSGGTESCLLAVKTARDGWRERAGFARSVRPRLVAPTTVHAAFHKAAALFDLDLDLVPCRADGSVRATDIVQRLDDDVALVVVSAPAYPSGALDPIAAVASAALARGVPCHVDACFGGFVLPWWPGLPEWDFRVPGVTSISADLHKFGYAPKGASVLLHRGRAPHRRQFFALTDWPGYPIVNPTLLGSRSASPTAAAWAITQKLGAEGYRELTAAIARSADAIKREVARIDGLTVLGSPSGPAISLIADHSVSAERQVDPHHLADEMFTHGFKIQHQPGLTQTNGVRLPHSAHLTITPVTERALPEFLTAMRAAADAVRGRPRASALAELRALSLLGYSEKRLPGPAMSWLILRLSGAATKQPKSTGATQSSPSLPHKLAPLMALVEALPAPLAETLLAELLARVSEP